MAILNYICNFAGQEGVKPRLCRLICTDTYAQVTAAGYMDGILQQLNSNVEPTDFIFCNYGTNSAEFGIFVPSISAGVVTLSAYMPTHALIAQETDAYAGGGTSNAFTATGLTAASIVTATISASTNAVSIAKAVPSTDTLTVTFSADPGAATKVNYIAFTPAV